MIEPPEGGGNVVSSLLLSLESQQACRQRHARGLGLELHGKWQIEEVLLGGDKEERAVFLEMSAQRSAELVLHVHCRISKCVRRSHVRVPVHVKAFAMPIIGAGFGHRVHETGVGAPNFGVQTAANDLKFPYGGQREEKYRVIAAALVALQRIVEVGAIERNIGIDGPLAGDHQAVAV